MFVVGEMKELVYISASGVSFEKLQILCCHQCRHPGMFGFNVFKVRTLTHPTSVHIYPITVMMTIFLDDYN